MLLIGLMCCLSCSDSHSDEMGESVRTASVYISLQIDTTGDETRAAGPSGGETGDGTEDGINNENKIERLVLFFFRADLAASINDRSNAENVPVIREFCENLSIINQSGATQWKTQPIELKNLEAGYEYYMAAVANAYHFQFDDIRTLKDLQDYEFTDKHWEADEDIAKFSRFVMSSRYRTADDMNAGKVWVGFGNDYNNPATATVYMQRLAARIDIIPISNNNATWNDSGYYQYTPTETSDRVRLEGIQLINKFNLGSYLLKHIAPATGTGEINYGAVSLIDQEEAANRVQTNYVVDLRTALKTGIKYPEWYDNYYINTFDWKPMVKCTNNASYILDYTMENTLSKQYHDEKHYVTALHLRCVYVPQGFTPGKTFYQYKDRLYPDLASLVVAVKADNPTENITEANVTERGEVSIYEDGICYYIYYIRHSDYNNDEDGIMKYGIVRNNIYRVTINSFSGLGSNDKFTPVPITKNVEFSIYVVPWNVIQNPEIIL